MKTVSLVRYAEATYDEVNVVYWQTFQGARYYITLSLDWYANGRLPADAMRLYVPKFPISMYTEFLYMDRMYNIPGSWIPCLNESGSPFIPYEAPKEL